MTQLAVWHCDRNLNPFDTERAGYYFGRMTDIEYPKTAVVCFEPRFFGKDVMVVTIRGTRPYDQTCYVSKTSITRHDGRVLNAYEGDIDFGLFQYENKKPAFSYNSELLYGILRPYEQAAAERGKTFAFAFK
jgi:hypothetical protein